MRTIESVFKLKDCNVHPSCIIYKGICCWGQTYIGETARNFEVRFNENNNSNKQCEPAKHINPLSPNSDQNRISPHNITD